MLRRNELKNHVLQILLRFEELKRARTHKPGTYSWGWDDPRKTEKLAEEIVDDILRLIGRG